MAAPRKTATDFKVSFKSRGGGDVTIDEIRKETISKGGDYELRKKTLLELESQYGALNASKNGKLEVITIECIFFINIIKCRRGNQYLIRLILYFKDLY